jgi:hypothetical protein
VELIESPKRIQGQLDRGETKRDLMHSWRNKNVAKYRLNGNAESCGISGLTHIHLAGPEYATGPTGRNCPLPLLWFIQPEFALIEIEAIPIGVSSQVESQNRTNSRGNMQIEKIVRIEGIG